MGWLELGLVPSPAVPSPLLIPSIPLLTHTHTLLHLALWVHTGEEDNRQDTALPSPTHKGPSPDIPQPLSSGRDALPIPP